MLLHGPHKQGGSLQDSCCRLHGGPLSGTGVDSQHGQHGRHLLRLLDLLQHVLLHADQAMNNRNRAALMPSRGFQEGRQDYFGLVTAVPRAKKRTEGWQGTVRRLQERYHYIRTGRSLTARQLVNDELRFRQR